MGWPHWDTIVVRAGGVRGMPVDNTRFRYTCALHANIKREAYIIRRFAQCSAECLTMSQYRERLRIDIR
jgi:hypothetical protein